MGLKINSKEGVFYQVEILEDFKSVRKDNIYVDPLDETIKFMKANRYNFEPALEMIQERYNQRLKVTYKEVNRWKS